MYVCENGTDSRTTNATETAGMATLRTIAGREVMNTLQKNAKCSTYKRGKREWVRRITRMSSIIEPARETQDDLVGV